MSELEPNCSNFNSTLPRVNSREVRKVVEDVIGESEVKPGTIRFFRGAMFNMVRFLMATTLFVPQEV